MTRGHSVVRVRASGKAGKTRWHLTRLSAWEAYERLSRRRGLPWPGHMPGLVNGDLFEPGRIQGLRNGHGVVFLEERER